ncbi:MAG: hypothetical protein M3552_02935 [Planctomycetota bacterium]|nr:hypothetical protein [Planctomycetaceae bacterium]MDQ3329600.1 hypothetical protein [Planctomycetota bacterium]
MKTLTKTLIAAGVGFLGTCGVATAAVPFSSAQSSYGIAAGGCYVPPTSNRYDNAYDRGYGDNYGSSYRPASTYDHAADPLWRNTNWGECNDTAPSRLKTRPYTPSSQFQSRYDTINHRYEDRYDGSPSFEPWRPLSASNAGRRNW